MLAGIHGSNAHSRQKRATTQVPAHRQRDEQIVVHLYSGVYQPVSKINKMDVLQNVMPNERGQKQELRDFISLKL